MLNTLKPFRSGEPDYHYFSPEDLAAMRHAYYIASKERPKAVQTHLQRMTLAKAIVVVFDPMLPEAIVLDGAWLVVRESYA